MTRSGSGFDAMAWWTVGAVALIAAAGMIVVTLPVPRHFALLVILGCGTTATLVILWQARSRRQGLSRLEQAAQRVLGVESIKAESAAMRPDAGDDLPDELLPLARSLGGLGDRMRQQLKEVAKKSRNLQSLIDAMDEPLFATDNQDRVLLCSRSAERILDIEPGTMIGKPIQELFTQAELREMHAAAKSGHVRRGRVRVVTPLGKRTYQVSASPVPAAWGEGVFGAVITMRDVTELDQSVQVKTDFVANASHELRTPVAAIRSAAETLETAADDPVMSERLRTMIVTHAQRLEEMLRDLLDLSRLETPDVPLTIEQIDLIELERILRQNAEFACGERKLSLSFEFDDELYGLMTDRKLLTLILRNLVENGTKFAHEGTTIRVVGTLAQAEVSRTKPSETAVVRFEVIDKGVGIPLAAQDRVFERYYQVDPARAGTQPAWRRGTGLGLAIVKHAARALHGRAALSSVWGQGTTVYVEFPAKILSRQNDGTARQVG